MARRKLFGLHDGEIRTLARRFFPAMARAIKGKVDAFAYGNPVFDAAFCASATAQDRPDLSDTEVITGQAPTRYALALLDLAEETKSLPRVEKDLKSFKKMWDSSVDLKRLTESPVFATEDKVAALTAVAKKAKFSPLTQQFIGTVAGNRRAADLPGIISAFNDMVARRRGTQVAKVTSAAKLTAAQTNAIKSQLKKSLGRPVDVETSVDPELLGGFVVRIGSRLYDSSLKTKLEDLRLALKEA